MGSSELSDINSIRAKVPSERANHSASLEVTFGGYSCKGEKAENQDAFALKVNQGQSLELKGHVAVIADGVSSANQAARASQMSVCHFIDEYLATPDTWSVHKSASKVIASLNNWLFSQQVVSDINGELQQWFSTFSAVVLKGNRCHLFHVGDCQVAKVNGDGYQVLTREHATAGGILNRALGAATHIEIDASTSALAIGDIIMLSCDGVYQFVKPRQIRELLKSTADLEQASKAITTLASKQGSLDNLTCLLIKIEQLPKEQFSELVFNRTQQVIPPALKVGVSLDHFEILDILEQTARSHVYLAKDNQAQRLVVLKMPSLNFSDDKEYLANFIKEGWLGEKLFHPSIMQIFPWRMRSRFLYHVCEYVDGQTLAAWLNENPKPSFAKVCAIAEQIVTCLRVFQRHDVVHSDIKLDNFMIDEHSRIKLIDFGSCDVGALVDEKNNQYNQPLGTISYSAPELFYGHRSNHQSELFSVAVVVYQLLTNQLPFGELSRIEQVPKQFNLWRYRPVTSYRKDLPTWLDMVLSKGLSADPSSRYQHYSEFIGDLNNRNKGNVLQQAKQPLIERDPVKFWQGVSALLMLVLLVQLFW
ncbi:bifunctional protein-serine/threonine kinase/phosphatase [Colwellia sp. RSH04]|uniref:bifunctional protein-serine/threonine kinase/phosphatase n=1 Tax=Colwellia sp. RSH04 TaxID=2305464 RepID=UPI000E56743E|nr:bifunctional protein-serine/threonine kinase/phosphatase [Colwellia sp. RSH04]RHW77447.1 bifunctional protein-serine/threonine kinase/phosphatase [Colwellia sp. RSH04]